MSVERAAKRFGLAAIVGLGSLGLLSSTALAGGGWNNNANWGQQQQQPQQQQPQQQRANQGGENRAQPQRVQERQQRIQERPQGMQERPQRIQERPQPSQRPRAERPRDDMQPEVNRERRQVNRPDRSDGWRTGQPVPAAQPARRDRESDRPHFNRNRPQQIQTFDNRERQSPASRVAPRDDRDGRRPADNRWDRNNNGPDLQRVGNSGRHDGNFRQDHHWNEWRNRHYVRAPRYHWDYDRRSRPWFDYNRVSYIAIYQPTYVIPYNAYETYGRGYYGPVSCNRDVVGAVLGGVAGGLIGAHNGGGGATVGGAIIGALLGGALGSAIDISDQACYGQVLEYAPNDQPVYWESDGAQYQVIPQRTYQASNGEYCREYQTSIFIDGREEQAYGTACRQPDGAWHAAE